MTKTESIGEGIRTEDVHVAIIFFDSRQLSFRTCIREATIILCEGIRKLQRLIIVLHFLPESNLQVLGEWVIQVHAQHGGNLIRFTIDIPWGLYILEKRKTVGFKMRRLERAPASLNQFVMHLRQFGVRLDSIGYYRQHWDGPLVSRCVL